jgi:hypothetical protein
MAGSGAPHHEKRQSPSNAGVSRGSARRFVHFSTAKSARTEAGFAVDA